MPVTQSDTADGRGESGDDVMEKVQEQFETYNKKFNRTRETDFMEFRSFKHMTRDIPCLGNIKTRDRFEVFNKQSTDGTGYLTFPQFRKAVNHIAGLEVEYRSYLNGASQLPATDDIKMQAIKEIQHLNPNNIRQWFKSLLNTIVDNEPAITKVSTAAGNALKEIGKTTVKDLAHVGTAVVWIGPAVKVLVIIWKRIIAFKEITDDLVKFADTLSYLTETIEFIEESSLYHTDMMKNRMLGLEKVLKKAKTLFDTVEEHGDNKVKKFFLAEDNQKQLKHMEEELEKWIGRTYFIQLAENQQLTIELQTQQQAMQNDLTEFMRENRFRWDNLEEQLSIIMTTSSGSGSGSCSSSGSVMQTQASNLEVTSGGDCRNAGNYAVPPGVEITRPNQTATPGLDDNLHVSFSPALPPELVKSNSDFLIYHDYDDGDKARELRDKLTKQMIKLRLPNGTVEKVRIHILDEFQSEGVPQAQLEAALKSASVKLLLITKKFTGLKNTYLHPLEIFSILQNSCQGEVFALRWDPGFNSYLKDLDFYVQGLMQGCFYDPHREDFVNKMNDLFKKHVKSRLDRDEELDVKRDDAIRSDEQEKKAKEQRMDDFQKRVEDIERRMQDTTLTVKEHEKLEKELANCS